MSLDSVPSPEPRLVHALAAGLFAIGVWQLAGCGGAEPRASVGSDAPATTVEGAEAELARLEASLDTAFGVPSSDSSSEPMPAPPPTAGGEPVPLGKKNEPASRCENACDALASMGRSADRICQLAGPGDRCEAAKSRVASASARVTAKCSECES